MHTTNTQNTLIEVAADCKAAKGTVPPIRGDSKTVANLEYEMISSHPYKFTADDVKFEVYAIRQNIPAAARSVAKVEYFSKGQPCFRASPLTKTYGWGVHSNMGGNIALFGCDSEEYATLLADKATVKVKAMRSKKV